MDNPRALTPPPTPASSLATSCLILSPPEQLHCLMISAVMYVQAVNGSCWALTLGYFFPPLSSDSAHLSNPSQEAFHEPPGGLMPRLCAPPAHSTHLYLTAILQYARLSVGVSASPSRLEVLRFGGCILNFVFHSSWHMVAST